MYCSKLKWVGGKSSMVMLTIGCHIQPQQHAGSSTHIQQFYPRFLCSTYAILHLKLLLHLLGCSTHLVVYHRLHMLSQAVAPSCWVFHPPGSLLTIGCTCYLKLAPCGHHIHVAVTYMCHIIPPPLRWGGLHAIIEVLSRASQVLLSSKMVLVPLLLEVYDGLGISTILVNCWNQHIASLPDFLLPVIHRVFLILL